MEKGKSIEKPKKPVKKVKPITVKPKKTIKGINIQHEIEREKRKPIVVEFKLMGSNFTQIGVKCAEILGLAKPVPHQTIIADWELIQAEWRAERIQSIDEVRDAELKSIEHLIHTCYNAWFKTITDNDKKSLKKKGLPIGENGKITTKEIEEVVTNTINYGNVSYLAEIRANQVERRKILGVYVAEKKEVKVENTGLGINDLNPEDKMKLAEMLLKYKK